MIFLIWPLFSLRSLEDPDLPRGLVKKTLVCLSPVACCHWAWNWLVTQSLILARTTEGAIPRVIIIIIRPNLIRILLGWDGLGLVSFCLVIFYQNSKSLNAGIITALSNRIGDVAILLSIAWILNYGRWNFLFFIEYIKGDYTINIISIFVVLAAFTKRAQIPFSSWLPAAIAAPTPVSSLVHSSVYS